ncbi:MAG: penicillin-binding transpeptidase domain-containing protein [bacterium]
MGSKRFKKIIRNRLKWLGVFYSFLFLIILFRSFEFQVINRKPWSNMAPVQYEHRIKLVANRGVIYDRDMNLLVMDKPIISLAVDPQKMNDYKTAAQKLSQVLSGESDYYLQLLEENKEKSFVRVAKEISEKQKQSLFNSGLKGLIIIKDRKRIRPFEDLAIQTLGLTNNKHEGVWGIEQSFDQVLKGKDGWAVYQKNGPGIDYFTCPEYPINVPENGRDIVLTLDHTFQSIVEEELSRGVIKHQAKYGSAVLLNPYTGEVLAMASIVSEKLKNKQVELVENSSNIGISKVGSKLGKEVLYKYIRNFGFGNKTGIRLPGETGGILRPIYDWSEFSTYAISFGQELSATPLQIACMMAAIANGGELIKPLIVKEILNDRGETDVKFTRKIIRRVVSQETADIIKSMLKNVVKYGSGEEAAIEGVEIAGKTGTAQKSMPGFKGYVPGLYTSSFVGMWPVEYPQFVMIVMLDEPKRNYWGGLSAAPLFANIVYRVSGISVKSKFKNDNREERKKNTFIFTNLNTQDDSPVIQNNTSIRKNKKINYSNRVSSPYHMPDVKGLSVRGALKIIGEYGIKVKVKGSGVVVKQNPSPGKDLKNIEECTLICNSKALFD